MFNAFIRSLLFPALLFLPQLAIAKSPVWKISSADKVLYLGGTIHLLSASDYPLPSAFDDAYKEADTLVFETDMQRLQQPAFQQEMLSLLMYPPGTSIEQKLDAGTNRELNNYLQKHGLPLKSFQRYKPGMLSMSLTMLEMQALGMAGTGVDKYYSDLALQEHKPQDKLETAISQIQQIAAMGIGQESEFIRHSLQELEALPKLFKELKAAWRSGDRQQLQTLALDPLSEFPDIYRGLIIDRNAAWLPSVITMLDSEPVEFVLVGAAHLVGEHGLLQQLEQLGYDIEQQ